MTSPGGGNDINLAALWIPIMPETSHMREGGRKAGEELMAGFREGVGSSGASLGQTLGSQLSSGFKRGIGNLELPGGLTNLTEGLMRGFEGLTSRTENQHAAFERLKASEEQLVNSHNRVAVAQSRLNDLQQRGVTSGTQYISAATGLISAKQREESAVRQTGEAHQGYQQALSRGSGGMMAFAAETGLLAGAVAGMIPLLGQMISGMVEFAEEGVSKAIEASTELVKGLIEIGEQYHTIGIQIQEFSTASGESLEELETAAQRVFSQLDVAGADTGRTMAMLASRLNTTDTEALMPLTRHVEELHGRFRDLQPESVATAFAALGVQIENADTVLASWLQSARGAGISTGALINSLAQVGESLRPEITHMSAEQIGEWVAEMSKVEPNVSRTVMALTGAQKVFSNKGLDFAAGMSEAVKELEAAGSEAGKEDLAEKLFGTRKWPAALEMAREYAQILSKPPPAPPPIDPFIRQTQELGNKWEEVKKKIELALLPLGMELLTRVSGWMDTLNRYVHDHSEQIARWVKNIGDSFIRMLPTIQTFAVDFLEFLKPIAEGVQLWATELSFRFGALAQEFAMMMDAIPSPIAKMIPGFEDARKGLHGFADAAFRAGKDLRDMPIGETFDKITDKVKGLKIDVPGLTRDFDNLSDSLGRRLGQSADQGINAVNPPGLGTGIHPPGAEPAAPGGPPETPGGAPGGEPPPPGAPGGAPGARPSAVQTPAQQGVYRAMVEAGWPNSWSAIAGIVAGEDASWDPTATNRTDSNAVAGNPSRGIGQLTLSNYRAAGVDPYTNDAYLQGKAMMSYIKGRYGTPEAAWQHWQGAHNYQTGGEIGGFSGDSGGDVPFDPAEGGGEIALDPATDAYEYVWPRVHQDDPNDVLGLKWRGTGQFNPNVKLDTSTTQQRGWNQLSPAQKLWDQFGFGVEDMLAPSNASLDKSVSGWFARHHFQHGGDVGTPHGSGQQEIPWWLFMEHHIYDQPAETLRPPGARVTPSADSRSVPKSWMVWPGPSFPMPGKGTHQPGDETPPGFPTFRVPGSHHSYSGPRTLANGDMVTGGRGGVDDIPAWLTEGEFVMNKKATSKWLKVLRWMNAKAFQGGGGPVAPDTGTGSANAAASNMGNDTAGVDQEILGATYIANKLGLKLTAGKSGHGTHDEDGGWHDKGAAGDFSNGIQTPQELAFAQYMLTNFASEMAELIHDSPALPQLVKDGKLYPKSIYAKWLPGHRDHVHVAFAPGSSRRLEALAQSMGQSAAVQPGTGAAGLGSLDFAGPGMGGATPGGAGGGSPAPGGPSMAPSGSGLGAPAIGSPGTTAGYGPYGLESYDQWYQANKAITGAQNRLDDLTNQISDKQNELNKANADLTKLQQQPGILQNDEQITTKTQERDRLQRELDQMKSREIPEASSALDEAKRKAWEDAQKPPGGQQEYKVPGVSAFTQLGGGLVKGFSQALGFGDILGKPPWEWGIVKLMSGMANWGLGTANAWAEEIGKGHTGMTGFQPVAGMEQSGSAGLEGVLKGFGLNVPMPQPQRVDRFGRVIGPAGPAPNIGAGPAPGAPGSPGPGNGPVINGDFMPINVSPNVAPSAVLGPVQAQRNADNANLHTFTGGMPPP